MDALYGDDADGHVAPFSLHHTRLQHYKLGKSEHRQVTASLSMYGDLLLRPPCQ